MQDLEFTEETLGHQMGKLYYPFNLGNILVHSVGKNYLTVLNKGLEVLEQITFEKIEITTNINNVALSPSNSLMAIIWSVWDGKKEHYTINLINTNGYNVIQQTSLEEEMMNMESFSISDDGRLYFAYPNLKTKEIILYKILEGKTEIVRKIDIKEE